uniref:RNA-directed DNA polymerase n=1 Tax=Phlebotomus papatasi TaxID=29031 RepID=A0A1B0GPN9_PHLPP
MNDQSGSSDTPTVGCSDGNVGLVLGLREVESMVASFNPDELSCPEAAEWLTSTEKTCLRYRMTEDQMMIIAGMRLKGAAKLWFEAMKSELNNWSDLKEQLKIYFPKVINIPQINRQLERKKKPEETAEMYVYEKLRLAKRAGTSDTALMQYVIEGIPNSSQRDILKSKDIKTIPELAEAIGKLEAPEKSAQKQYSTERKDKVFTEKSEDRGRSRSRWRGDSHARNRSKNEGYDDRRPQRWRKSQSRHSESHKDYRRDQRNEHQDAGVSTKREKDSSTPPKSAKDSQKTHKRLCYICRSEEHLAARCPKNKDFRVRLVGAVASRKTNNELLVKIGEKSEVIDAIMDTGSDITIIKDSKMAALGVPLEGKPVKFKSFGGKEGITRGFANIQLSVEDITKTVRVHVVPDSYMTVSMILGKDFFNDDDVEGTISGSGVAIKRKRTSTAVVNQINESINKRERYCSPIRAEELQVGKAARDDDVKKLIRLLNVYRKCFAKNISELGKSSVVTMNVETKAITDFERPDTQRKMRQFLGLTGYFRKFVPGFAQITQPLRAALVGPKDSKSNDMIEWTPGLQKAFAELKDKLVNKPILELYSPSAEHELHYGG